MQASTQQKQLITNCLWFDKEAEEAANFYTSIFKNSSIEEVTRYGKERTEIHHQSEGTVMTVRFKLNGQEFIGLNGGPLFPFNESISLMVNVDTQEEIDYYWERLTEGGEESQCGWLKDKFGVSWQVVPNILGEMMADPDRKKADRVMKAFMQMKKYNIQQLQDAFNG